MCIFLIEPLYWEQEVSEHGKVQAFPASGKALKRGYLMQSIYIQGTKTLVLLFTTHPTDIHIVCSSYIWSQLEDNFAWSWVNWMCIRVVIFIAQCVHSYLDGHECFSFSDWSVIAMLNIN